MSMLLQDIRYALRTFARTPSYALAVVLVLTLGIAANAAVFSIVSAALLRPLPYEDADRLVQLLETYRAGGGSGRGSVSAANFEDWRAAAASFQDMAISAWPGPTNLQHDGVPERLTMTRVGTNLFPLLGARPLVGRVIVDGDGADVVVLSEALWERRFGGDAAVIGSRITLDGTARTVVGVMPHAFAFPIDAGRQVDLWMPLVLSPDEAQNREAHSYAVTARLAAGVTLEEAVSELRGIAARIEREFAHQDGRSADAILLSDVATRQLRRPLLMLLGAAAFVLLIACANAANLLLARASTREREVAVRAALGASRRRIAAQFLTESALLGSAAAAGGILLAVWGSRALLALAGSMLPARVSVGLDWQLIAFLLGTTTLTVILFGGLPAVQAARPDLQSMLRQGAQGGGGTLRSILVVPQMALSVVLLVGAGLLMRTFIALTGTETGMGTQHVLVATVAPAASRAGEGGTWDGLYAPLLEAARALPGVDAVGMTSHLPLRESGFNGHFGIVGAPAARLAERPIAELRLVSPGYFTALGVPIIEGRDLTDHDVAGAPPVVLFNEAAARRYFPGRSPVGERINFLNEERTVVGVVADVRQIRLEWRPAWELYFPHAQFAAVLDMPMTLVAATRSQPLLLAGPLRDVVRAVDPTLPLYDVSTLERVISASVSDRRLYLWLLGTFAAAAMTLAIAGIYGVVAFTVSRRTREIGIRLALGSEPAGVQRLVVWQGFRLALVGLVLGIICAFALTRLLDSVLYGVSTRDPLTFAAVCTILGCVAAAASYVPARRAAGLSPMVTLRSE
jgi:putative ABC transport system permease protein